MIGKHKAFILFYRYHCVRAGGERAGKGWEMRVTETDHQADIIRCTWENDHDVELGLMALDPCPLKMDVAMDQHIYFEKRRIQGLGSFPPPHASFYPRFPFPLSSLRSLLAFHLVLHYSTMATFTSCSFGLLVVDTPSISHVVQRWGLVSKVLPISHK